MFYVLNIDHLPYQENFHTFPSISFDLLLLIYLTTHWHNSQQYHKLLIFPKFYYKVLKKTIKISSIPYKKISKIQPIIKFPPLMFKTLSKPCFLSISPSSSDDEDSPVSFLDRTLHQNESYQSSLLSMLSLIESRLHLNNLKLDLYDFLKKQKKGSYKRRFWLDQISFYPFDEDSDKIPEALRVLKLIRSQQKKKNISHFLSKIMQELDENTDDLDEDDYFPNEGVIPKPLKTIKSEPLLTNFIALLPKKDPQEINWIALAKKVNADILRSRDPTKSVESGLNSEYSVDLFKGPQCQDLMELSNLDVSPFFNAKTNPPSLITGLQLYKSYISFHKILSIQAKWSNEDDEMLAKAVLRHGVDDWKQIANYLDGKDTGACFQRWFKYVNPSITKGKWTMLEDIKLALYLEFYGKGKWSIIAKKFINRTDVQIRERWCNILDPRLKTGNKWKSEEDELLLKEAPKNKFRWSVIASLFDGRTDNQCTRRYKKLTNVKIRPREEKKLKKKGERDSPKMKELKRERKNLESEEMIMKIQLMEAIARKIPIFKIIPRDGLKEEKQENLDLFYEKKENL